jgi:hypothetical protein
VWNMKKGKELRMLCVGKREKVRSTSRLGTKVWNEQKTKELRLLCACKSARQRAKEECGNQGIRGRAERYWTQREDSRNAEGAF